MPGTLTCAVVSEIKGLLKFSQEELSTISGMPRSTLTKILAGTSIIDLEQLAKIASALNTSVGAIIQRAESRLTRAEETSITSPAPTLQAVPSSPVEDEEELPDFSQMAARTVSDEQYRRIMTRKRFFDDLGEGVAYLQIPIFWRMQREASDRASSASLEVGLSPSKKFAHSSVLEALFSKCDGKTCVVARKLMTTPIRTPLFY